MELTREKFEAITAALLESTISMTPQMLSEASQQGYSRFDKILLVGGSTRMPQISSRLKKEHSVEIEIFDPDESVAKGAAFLGRSSRSTMRSRSYSRAGLVRTPTRSISRRLTGNRLMRREKK